MDLMDSYLPYRCCVAELISGSPNTYIEKCVNETGKQLTGLETESPRLVSPVIFSYGHPWEHHSVSDGFMMGVYIRGKITL